MRVHTVKHSVHDESDGPRIASVAALLVRLLVQRACKSRATGPAIGVLIWLLGWRTIGSARYAIDSLVGLAVVVLVVRRRMRRPKPSPPYEPTELQGAQDDVDYWCSLGGMRAPQVITTWETETGRAYYIRVTTMTDTEGKPMSTATFASYGAYLRDLVGAGCHSVHVLIDPKNGGRATMYVNWAEAPEPYRQTVQVGHEGRVCLTEEQYERALADAEAWEQSEAERAARAEPARRWARIIENPDHYARANELTDEEWERLEDELPVAYARITGRETSAQRPDDIGIASPTPETGPGEPSAPVLITEVSAHISSGEGTAATFEAPTGAPVPAPPPGVPLSDGAREVAWLLRDGQPRRRGQIADALETSPNAVDRELAELAAVGAVRKIGQTWTITTQYPTSGTVSSDGRQEAPASL